MDVGLLYSGGTDSTLAALLLDPVADGTRRDDREVVCFSPRPVEVR